jgi:hypothetical protein
MPSVKSESVNPAGNSTDPATRVTTTLRSLERLAESASTASRRNSVSCSRPLSVGSALPSQAGLSSGRRTPRALRDSPAAPPTAFEPRAQPSPKMSLRWGPGSGVCLRGREPPTRSEAGGSVRSVQVAGSSSSAGGADGITCHRPSRCRTGLERRPLRRRAARRIRQQPETPEQLGAGGCCRPEPPEPRLPADHRHQRHACKGSCRGTSVLFRRSTDGGAIFGPETFVCVGRLQDDRVAV